jgi:hypothetical protein
VSIEIRDTWFDRLAAPRTRRQALQAALAGAALTLPFARIGRSAAAGLVGHASGPCVTNTGDPHACRKGCLWTSTRRFLKSYENTCFSAYNACSIGARGVGATTAGLLYSFGVGGSLLLGAVPAATTAPVARKAAQALCEVANNKCTDLLLLRLKAEQFDCLQPDCPGFDPCGKDGPCEVCRQTGGVCCPDARQDGGYACCTAPPGGCCKDDGCHSGTTDCGSG